MILLKEWNGRLGNNIIQLSNAIHIAIAFKHNIKIYFRHRLFDVSVIEKYFTPLNI